MKIVVALRNPVKIDGVKEAFQPLYSEAQVEGIETVSGIPDQP